MLVPVDHESSRALRPRRRVPLDVQLGALFAMQKARRLREPACLLVSKGTEAWSMQILVSEWREPACLRGPEALLSL